MALIKSETLVKRLNKLIAGVDEESDALISVRDVLRLISVIQTVDAVEVVRCKYCKHRYYAENRVPSEQTWVCEKDGLNKGPDWYCADGERRKDDG